MMNLEKEKHNFGLQVEPVMEVWKKVLGYLTFRKPGPDEPSSFNLKMMHGINKVSIFMFLIAIIIMVVKCLT